MSIGTLSRQHYHTDDTARAAIPLDSFLQRLFDEINGIRFLHALLPVGVAEAVDVRRTRAADRVRLFVKGSTEGNAVDLATVALIPARDNETSPGKHNCQLSVAPRKTPPRGHLRQLILVCVADLLEDGCGGLCRGGLAACHVE